MKHRFFPVLLILLGLLIACRPRGVAPLPTVAPTTAPASPTAMATTVAPQPTSAPGSTDASTPSDAATSVALFDIAPGDRSVFAAGLVASERPILDGLVGAPVYHLDVTLDPSLTTVSGRQTVFYTNQEDIALEELYFHLHANTLDGAIRVSDLTVDGAPATADTGGDVLRVSLPASLAPGASAVISMSFETSVPTDIGRNYGVLAYFDNILALAHFYPMLAVYDQDGWNIIPPDIKGDLTYSDPAFYLARVRAPADITLVGSGSIIEQSGDDATQIVSYASGPARDFYLAAGDFIVVSETVGETTINSYAPAEAVDGAALALEVAGEALTIENARLGPYPYTELDIVTTPTSALGIEYPGLIVGTLRMYAIDQQTAAGIPFSAILESTTAHEVIHQWFYNLLGNDQLDEPWLDEGVTSYQTYRYFGERYGQRTGDIYFESLLGRWEAVDQALIPIGKAVAEYADEEYTPIVYGRGAVFLRELEETIGRETFDAFLRAYVARFRWGRPTTADFQAMAETQCACDLDGLFNEWVHE
jgi:hypothetical protein